LPVVTIASVWACRWVAQPVSSAARQVAAASEARRMFGPLSSRCESEAEEAAAAVNDD
jgi:hypothetical protein